MVHSPPEFARGAAVWPVLVTTFLPDCTARDARALHQLESEGLSGKRVIYRGVTAFEGKQAGGVG